MIKRMSVSIVTAFLCILISVVVIAGELEFDSYATKGDKKIWVKVTNSSPGDYVVISNGKKSATITLDGEAETYCWMKTSKLKVGKMISAIMYNANGQVLDIAKDIVYYKYKLKRGMTKKQVMQTPIYLQYDYEWFPSIGEYTNYSGLGEPDDIKRSSGGYTWWYWDDGSFLCFRHGRLRSWYY